MSVLSKPPANFLKYNDEVSKQLAVVCQIEGLDLLSSTTIGRKMEYGDPDIVYGGAGLIYGGLVEIENHQSLLNLEGSSLTISQRLEPEQGRASIGTLSMCFIDKDQYMTQAISPGVIIDEILGKEVKIWLGYRGTSFPDDYFVVWRGRVAQVSPEIGRVTLQFTDPNIVRRQDIFYPGKTQLSLGVDNVVTTIPVVSNGDFYNKITGPDGTYDTNVKCYIKIDDEFMEYQQVGHESDGLGVNQFLHVVRGSRGTTAAAHDVDADVDAFIEISGHAIDLALKLMLSGWNGPYKEDQAIQAFSVTGDPDEPTISNAIVLPVGVDAVRDLGLAIGDYITSSGATIPGNDISGIIVIGFQDLFGHQNRIILTDQTFTDEDGSPALLSLRSQYDTLPTVCGCKLPSWEVDVAGHIYYRQTFLQDDANAYRFLKSDKEKGKTFIESQIMLPLGAYCLTRQGRLSMGFTKPPIADERTVTLRKSNVLEPQTIRIERSLNNRKYFNEIDWSYDYYDNDTPGNRRKALDTDSLNAIGISSVLPIDAKGARTDLNFDTIVTRRERFLFLRYSKAAVIITVKTNFGVGNQIEVGDVVILQDNGELQIPNMTTGERNLGSQLLEVINRDLDLKTGQVNLQLLGGIGALVGDRYATISPSSLVVSGSTSSRIVFQDSFGSVFPGAEWRKWIDYVGLKVRIHSADETNSDEVTFTGLDPSNNYAMLVSPALSFTPAAGDIIDVADYPDNADATDQALYKLVHCFLDPSVAVASGASDTQFTVATGEGSKFQAGQLVLIHNDDYSTLSDEVEIQSVAGDVITVSDSLGFTPDNTMTCELIGFPDYGAPYRFV